MTIPIKPWRFVAVVDIPALGVLSGDVVTHVAGEPIRVTRYLPCNTGLLLNLLMQDELVEMEGNIDPDERALDAIEAAKRAAASPSGPPLRVIR